MYYVGIDIGGTSIKYGIVDEQGQVLAKASIKIVPEEEQEYTIYKLGGKINDFIAINDFQKEEIGGIGVGCPGAINSKTGCCDFSGNLHWNYNPIVRIMEEVTGIRTRISNDANVAALGEAKFGAGRKYHDVVMLTLGTGLGGGIVLGGKLYEGNEGKGAEVGHAVLKMGGRRCTCGRIGCMETYASATALILDTKTIMRKNKDSLMWDFVNGDIRKVDGRTAFECSKKGDEAAIKVVNWYVHDLSETILNFCNIFRPDAIIIGGGVCAQGDYLLDKVRGYLDAADYGFASCPKVDVLIASLGNDAGIIGAASLMFEE